MTEAALLKSSYYEAVSIQFKARTLFNIDTFTNTSNVKLAPLSAEKKSDLKTS